MAIKPIDMHVHPPIKEYIEITGGQYLKAIDEFYKVEHKATSIVRMIEDFDKAGVSKGVIFGWDAETASGLPKTPNDLIAEIVSKYPERLIGFASVDPWKGKMAIKEVERATKELNLKGLKFNPPIQAFFPDDYICYPIYEKCVELKIPVLFHTGFSGLGMGKKGGLGIKLKYGKPMPHIDNVATDFPELTIIAAHNGWPWENELISIVMHKANVYMELSGWLPRYIPKIVLQYMNTMLQDKCLFGSDYPYIPQDRWLQGFKELQIKDGVAEKVLEENAKRVLKL